MNKNVIGATSVVIAFWWIVLGVYGLMTNLHGWGVLFQSSVFMALFVAVGCVSGALLVLALVRMDRQARAEMLASENIRGLICSIGEVPMLLPEPQRSSQLPDLSAFPNIPPDHFENWFRRYSDRPAHVALMKALILIFAYRDRIPATHVYGGHGGRTLLQHSLLVSYFSHQLGQRWKYDGLRDRSGKRIVVKLRDSSYTFNNDDPMMGIIGLAHDIGKIEAFIYDREDPDKVVGIGHEHDLTGARMLARIPEIWDLPEDDRMALILSVAHYHHPMDLPLSPDRRAIDDRTIALMELLIKADFVTSKVESRGVVPTDSEYEEHGKNQAIPESVSQTTMWDAFVELIHEIGRINGTDPRYNIGTLCMGDGFDKPVLMFKEDALRPALMKRLNLPTANLLGDGRYQLTIDLLREIDARGLLYKEHDGVEYSAENALWNVDFMTRPASGAMPTKRSGWSAVFIMDPKEFPRLEKMEQYWWFAVIQRGTMGAARARNKGKKPTIKPLANGGKLNNFLADLEKLHARQEGDDETPADEGAEATARQETDAGRASDATKADADGCKNTVPEVQASQKPEEAARTTFPWDDDAEDETQPTEVSEAHTGPASGHATRSPTLTEESKPLSATAAQPGRTKLSAADVNEALKRAVETAHSKGLKIREIKGRYVMSAKTLSSLVPDVDWAGASYAIGRMATSGKIAAQVVGIEGGASYAVVVQHRGDEEKKEQGQTADII